MLERASACPLGPLPWLSGRLICYTGSMARFQRWLAARRSLARQRRIERARFGDPRIWNEAFRRVLTETPDGKPAWFEWGKVDEVPLTYAHFSWNGLAVVQFLTNKNLWTGKWFGSQQDQVRVTDGVALESVVLVATVAGSDGAFWVLVFESADASPENGRPPLELRMYRSRDAASARVVTQLFLDALAQTLPTSKFLFEMPLTPGLEYEELFRFVAPEGSVWALETARAREVAAERAASNEWWERRRRREEGRSTEEDLAYFVEEGERLRVEEEQRRVEEEARRLRAEERARRIQYLRAKRDKLRNPKTDEKS